MAILREHVRLWLDARFIRDLCWRRGWDSEAVENAYQMGIDWSAIRLLLKGGWRRGLGTQHPLRPLERRGLEIVVTGAFWDDRRRHAAGYTDSDSCRVCGWESGSDRHILHAECTGMAADMMLRRLAGNDHPMPIEDMAVGLEPLLMIGLPPRVNRWEPVADHNIEGVLTDGFSGDAFGDGSCITCSPTWLSTSTWSVVRLEATGTDQLPDRSEAIRGVVPGRFSTVPRAEITAVEYALRHALVPARYIGDNRTAIEVSRDRVPPWFKSSACANADLWRRISAILDDHGGDGIDFIKTKAHRSMSSAMADQVDNWRNWRGNNEADRHCKELAIDIAAADPRIKSQQVADERAEKVLRALASAAGWALRNMPNVLLTKVTRRGAPMELSDGGKIGGHTVMKRKGGGWSCLTCGLCCWTNAGARWLRGKPCRGTFAKQVHPSHTLHETGEIRWCRSCGAYAVRMPRTLKDPCRGRPMSVPQCNVRRRLLAGLPPTTSPFHAAAASRTRSSGAALAGATTTMTTTTDAGWRCRELEANLAEGVDDRGDIPPHPQHPPPTLILDDFIRTSMNPSLFMALFWLFL